MPQKLEGDLSPGLY